MDSLTLPSTFTLPGAGWSPCAEEEGELPQVEGMVADQKRGFLYAAQEDVGIWRIAIDGAKFAQPTLFDRVREFGQPYTRTFDPEEEEFVCEIDESAPSFGSEYLAADSEGLTVYPLRGDRGYLLASSQGSSTFIVYDRISLALLGLSRSSTARRTRSTSPTEPWSSGCPWGHVRPGAARDARR